MICIFIFYSKAEGYQKIFSFGNKIKHCNLVIYKDGMFTGFEFNKGGLKFKVYKEKSFTKLISNILKLKYIHSIIVTRVIKRKNKIWSPYIVRSCNEICRLLSGIDTGLCINPQTFYNAILKKKTNYEIFWRKDMFGGDDNLNDNSIESYDPAMQDIEKQIQQADIETQAASEAYRNKVFQITKSQGAQDWNGSNQNQPQV